ncbi:Ig-like domain (group 2) [Caloramator quimbayensis]|uniref:Ig-like domain (Group 2) n=1 Tax=Caloramator quimbayensis TaxID=1147123 RepID=A0A1T4XZF2_9CLOT|nr:Ig-like domain-containing protein [Caloramator quimbayensis]SKA94441.1 Ig-like domain (group 2) [Caloramator quimbayensis]
MNIFDFPQNDYFYALIMAGDNIYINNDTTSTKALISNLPVNRQADIRIVSTTAEIKRGDLINWLNEKWLIISDIGHKRYSYYKGIIQKCNYNIKFNFQGIVKQFPCIIDSKVFDIETNQYLSIPAGKIVVTMQDNADSTNIIIGQRFIKMKQAWKVTGIDRTKNGLLILYCDLDSIISSDDLINEIANAGDYIYTLEITNGETASIQAESTLQLNTQVKLNGNVVTDKTVTFSCDNTSIATVDSNGLITAIEAGECIITAYLTDNPNVYDTISILVTALPQHNYSVSISGNTSIVKDKTATYTATFTDNGQPITETSEFYLTGDDGVNPTTLATIQSQDANANTCIVKANSTNIGYVKLWVKNTAGTIISEPFRIQIKNIF